MCAIAPNRIRKKSINMEINDEIGDFFSYTVIQNMPKNAPNAETGKIGNDGWIHR